MLLYFLCYKRSDRLLCKLFNIFTEVLTWIERYILRNDEIKNGPELSYNYDNDINL